MVSYKPAFKFKDQEKLGLNAQAFATHREAEQSAASRFMRWTMPIGYEVVESDEPVNYRWDDEKGDVPINREVTA